MRKLSLRTLLKNTTHSKNKTDQWRVASMLCSATLMTAITGCATTEPVEPVKQPRRFTTTVSSSSGLFVPTRQQPIVWDGTITISDSAHRLTADREQQISSALKNELQQRGIQFTTDAGAARFAMKAAMLVGTDINSAQLNNLCGVAPQLQKTEGIESAALGVCFTEQDTQQVVWKSATDVIIRSPSTETEQIERIHRTIRDMLSGLPAAR